MNPAVTIGVFISRMKYSKDLPFFLMILLSEIAGGFGGVGLAYGSLYAPDLYKGHKIIADWVPLLCPQGVDSHTETPTGTCDYHHNRHF